jgi:NAD(P)-dependent dehydrogenase (short-subunit alcohol dehydrogenase family)
MRLRGANVVIIGGSSGMGFAAAQLVKNEGAKVIIASRSSEKLQRAVEQLGDAQAIVADMTNESDVERIFRDLDHVDHVFVSAGGYFGAKVIGTDLDIFRSNVAQKFWGPLYIVRNAAPKMTNGSITFLTGQLASRPAADAVVTSAMHAALETLAKGLALELAPIRVNALAAGIIDTPLWGDFRDEAEQDASKTLPVKRMGSAQEVAQAVILLMTNGFITGEILHVDGGGRLV